MRTKAIAALVMSLFLASPVLAQPIIGVAYTDSGDTAWVLAAAALALLTIIPGLALYFSGQVRSKNAISVTVQIFVVMAIVSLFWIAAGYSLAFSEGSPYLGGLENGFLASLAELRADTTVPESAFIFLQMMFAIFAVSLLIGSVAERVQMGWLLAFCLLWSLLVYVPVAHWVWGNGWLADIGVHDFAGSSVVHLTAGVSALALAFMIKARAGIFEAPVLPHSPVVMMGGLGLLWVGWLALSGGAALSASDDAATALINTHVAACAGALVWAVVEHVRMRKVSPIGVVLGALSGLVAISSAADYLGPIGAMLIGATAALAVCGVAALLRNRLRIDDTFNIFAVHGVGGIVGTILFPLLMLPGLGTHFQLTDTMAHQIGIQALAVGAIAAWSAGVTVIIGLGITLILPMRVTADTEELGLDKSSH